MGRSARARVLVLLVASSVGALRLLTACTESPSYVGSDPGAPADGGARDGGAWDPGDGGASACAPADVEDFQPQWVRPKDWHPGTCTDQELKDFRGACLGSDVAKYSDACLAFRKSGEHQKCAGCIFDKEPDQFQAALLVTGAGHLVTNRAGCIWNTARGASSAECAAAYQALIQCESHACTTNCPLSMASGDRDFLACTRRVAAGGCQRYREKADTCDALFGSGDAGAPARQCVQADESAMVEMFCGKGPTDGG